VTIADAADADAADADGVTRARRPRMTLFGCKLGARRWL
jgi:hypothetical protein